MSIMEISLANLRSILKNGSKGILYVLISLLPSDNDLWVFTSHEGTSFAENAKYQFIHSSHQEDKRAVWISQNENIVSMLQAEGYEAYSYQSLRGKLISLKSGTFFITHGWKLGPYSGNATIIQLWHGNMLKKMGDDTKIEKSFAQKLHHRTIGRGWDYFVVTSSSYPARHAQSAYDIAEKDLLVTGYPRTDPLIRDIPGEMIGIGPEISRLFTSLREEGPLLCLVPTWNGGRDEQTRFSEEHIEMEEIDEILNKYDANLVIKQHPYTESLIDDGDFENIAVTSESADMYPMLKYVDVLITDYSSIFFDYLLTNGELIFYPYDLGNYLENRGLYFEYDEITPGPKAYTPKQLNQTISSVLSRENSRKDNSHKKDRLNITDEFYRYQDGNAAERIHTEVCERIDDS